MKKTVTFLLTLIVTFPILLTAGNVRTKPFALIIPQNIIENSLYNKIEFLDSRLYKDNFGYVQTGMFNSYAYLVDEVPFAKQIDSLMSATIDQTAQEKTLLFQLRNLNFSEITKSMSETGYCHIRISLFEEDYPNYYLISTLDTLFQVKAMDVTGKLLKSSSEIITSFVSDNLLSESTDKNPFSFADIHNIDAFEKNNMKAYWTDSYTNGVYPDYRSFFDQIPYVEEVTAKFAPFEGLTEIKIKEPEKNKLKKVDPKKIFAAVVNGQPYISSGKSYIPIYRGEDNEFRFMNDGNIRINAGAMIGGMVGGLALGLLTGMFIVPMNTSTPYKVEMTIDHISGNFVVLPRKPKTLEEE